MEKITFSAYQKQVDDWITSIGVRYFNHLTNLGQLTEEVGELAHLMIRLHGEQSFKDKSATREDKLKELADELADCIFTLTCIANTNNVDLEAALMRNMDKKTKRDATRHHQNSKLAK